MTEQGFQFTKEGSEILNIKTPFPVNQNVWASFMLDIFPQFQIPPEHMTRHRHNGRYLNRKTDFDEIADGQILGYIHGYLPHGERSHGRVGVSGLVHVPEKRIFYLEQIQADLEENPRSRISLLDSLNRVQAETISYLLNQLMDVQKVTTYKDVKTTKELRDRFGKTLADIDLLKGYYSDYEKPRICADEIDKIPIGKLPLFIRDQDVDFLRSQTCLDFLRNLDDVAREDRELNPIDLLLQIPALMNQKYSEIVKI